MADAVVEEQEPAKEIYAIAKVGVGFDEDQDPSAKTTLLCVILLSCSTCILLTVCTTNRS